MTDKIPILFFGDAPTLPTGLGRIGRDLATLLSRSKDSPFEVGFFARGGIGSSTLPFRVYPYQPQYLTQWGTEYLEQVWNDFAGDRLGVIFTIWDPSRLDWFALPENLPDEGLKAFLQSGRFARWGYFAIDSYSAGPQQLSCFASQTVERYDRVLAYTRFGRDILQKSSVSPVDWLPHGINKSVYYPRDRNAGRLKMMSYSHRMQIDADSLLIGCVMTNQARKDWGLMATAARIVLDRIPTAKFWWHTNTVSNHWDINALLEDFNLWQSVLVTTGEINDNEMALLYSACDVTVLPSLGEGFGYPIVESMACGVPVIHGAYGGGAELIPTSDWLIEPTAYRLDTRWNVVRPVYDPAVWAEKMIDVPVFGPPRPARIALEAVEHLDWKRLWPTWRRWFREGVGA